MGLIRDSGRIMSLKLCSVLTQTLVLLSKKEDSDLNGNRVIEVIIMLVKLLSLMTVDDRHRVVINQRFSDVIAKGVL
jgi:hypothetical protein